MYTPRLFRPKNGGRLCQGNSRRYASCNTEPCAKHSIDIRVLQCHEFSNATVRYIPVHSTNNPCALHCRPSKREAHYSIMFRTKVIDGTRCRHSSNDICIDGKCVKLGCDNKLNSVLQKDVCGVCGGNGTTCNLVEGEFTQPLGKGKKYFRHSKKRAQTFMIFIKIFKIHPHYVNFCLFKFHFEYSCLVWI